MAARCPVCEHALDHRSIRSAWREIRDRTLDCPHCGQVLELTTRSGILIGVVSTGISIALFPLGQTLLAHGMSKMWFIPLYCVALYLLSGFLYLQLGRYRKHTTLSIR